MTENDFQGLFGDDFAEINAAMLAAEAEVQAEVAAKPVKDGMSYVHDEQGPNGHTISVYRLALGGKIVLWALVDNDLEVSTDGLGHVPAGVTGHAISVASADRSMVVPTKGIALRAKFSSGVRVSGQTVTGFVLPRAGRWIGQFYGV